MDRDQLLRELSEFLRIPSVSTLPAHDADVRRAAEWVAGELRRLRCEVDFLGSDTHPVVWGVGPDVPWVQARLAGAYMDARDEMRESKLYSAGLLAGKRFDGRIDARIGYTYDVRDGKDGPVSSPSIPTDVFDQRAQTVSLDAGYILADRLLVTAGYAYRYGDTDSACDGENIATVLAGEDVKALATESAFREPFCVYRLTGRVHSISLSASYSVLKGHGSLNLGFQRSYGKSRSLDYESGVIRAGFVYSY
jgi:hypothetical protein